MKEDQAEDVVHEAASPSQSKVTAVLSTAPEVVEDLWHVVVRLHHSDNRLPMPKVLPPDGRQGLY